VDRPTDPSSGLVGAGESATPPGVPAEDRWMGGDGSAVAPRVLMEGAALLPRPMRRRGRVDLLPCLRHRPSGVLGAGDVWQDKARVELKNWSATAPYNPILSPTV